MADSPVLQKVIEYTSHILRAELPKILVYHNYKHTCDVVEASITIGKEEGLGEEDIELLTIGAWFHDTGHKIKHDGHEEASKWLAKDFLATLKVPESKIACVLGLIEATKLPQSPKNKMEMAICDADLSHLAMPNFMEKNEQLRKEWGSLYGKVYSEKEWIEQNIHFMTSQAYFTNYGKTVLAQKKAENMKTYRKILSQLP